MRKSMFRQPVSGNNKNYPGGRKRLPKQPKISDIEVKPKA